ncbi:hypothetical protein [Streptomyces sp. CA-106131]|uniref:hypothetical protein n=1 Tax=Streptomyces sp. CA-106131 TaxID=3240045 RepID=UPI003D8BCB39
MNTVMITRVAEAQWEAVANDRIVGHGDVSHRPDGRLFVSIDVWQDAIFDQLAAAMLAELPEPLYTLVGEADHELKSSWERLGFTGFLRGCPGLQAGEESDSCGAGQGQPDRRQGDPASTPHGRDAAHNGQELSTVSPPR